MPARRAFLSLLASAPALLAASPKNWPQFRGPGSRGVSGDDPRLPESWSPTENIAWRTPVPGMAWSSPVVWGDRVFLTNCISEGEIEPLKKGLYSGGNRPEPPKDVHRWSTLCLDLSSGDLLWEREVARRVPESARHLKNSFASETPVADAERFYAHFAQLGTFCYDHSGELVWEKRWPSRETRYGWGTASSPALHEGRLYLVLDNEEESFLVALDKASGEEIWRVPRSEKSNWSTPYVWENERRTEIITTSVQAVRSYDLDGKLLWSLGPMSSIVIPTPFSDDGLLYVASGYVGDETRPVYVVRPGAEGEITADDEAVAWHLPQGAPYNPSPLLYGGYYYTLYDRGFLTCHDARTGREVYDKQRFRTGASAFTASPWAYNGKLFCLSEDGDCFVVEAGPEYRLIRENSIGDELCMSTPAIADGSLLLRTAEAVYRIGG